MAAIDDSRRNDCGINTLFPQLDPFLLQNFRDAHANGVVAIHCVFGHELVDAAIKRKRQIQGYTLPKHTKDILRDI